MGNFMKKINILLGRFQPFTSGHYRCIDAAYKKNGLPSVICMIGVDENRVDKRHPFTSDMLVEMYNDLFEGDAKIEGVVPVKSANIIGVAKKLKDLGYQIASWTCGSDRILDYTRMSNKYKDAAELADEFEMIEVPRSDEDISATKARDCLLRGDRDGFKAMLPSGDEKLKDTIFNILQEQIEKVYNEDLERRVHKLEYLIRWMYR